MLQVAHYLNVRECMWYMRKLFALLCVGWQLEFDPAACPAHRYIDTDTFSHAGSSISSNRMHRNYCNLGNIDPFFSAGMLPSKSIWWPRGQGRENEWEDTSIRLKQTKKLSSFFYSLLLFVQQLVLIFIHVENWIFVAIFMAVNIGLV